jgi:hypothetical protein
VVLNRGFWSFISSQTKAKNILYIAAEIAAHYISIYLRFLKLFIYNFRRQLETTAVGDLPFLHTFVPTYATFPNPSSIIVSWTTFSKILRIAARFLRFSWSIFVPFLGHLEFYLLWKCFHFEQDFHCWDQIWFSRRKSNTNFKTF